MFRVAWVNVVNAQHLGETLHESYNACEARQIAELTAQAREVAPSASATAPSGTGVRSPNSRAPSPASGPKSQRSRAARGKPARSLGPRLGPRQPSAAAGNAEMEAKRHSFGRVCVTSWLLPGASCDSASVGQFTEFYPSTRLEKLTAEASRQQQAMGRTIRNWLREIAMQRLPFACRRLHP